MKEKYAWVDQVNQIIGAIGEIEQYALELTPILAGQSIEHGEKRLFYLGEGQCLSYPCSLLNEQIVKFIELLINQAASRGGEGTVWDAFFRNIVNGKPLPHIQEQATQLGVDTTCTFLPMIVNHSLAVTPPVVQIIESYFERKVFKGMVDDSGYYLIPLQELSLDPQDQEAQEELGRGLGELLVEEGIDGVRMAFMPSVSAVEEWGSSFQTGQLTLHAGKVFHEDQNVYFSWNMTLELLLSEISKERAVLFIKDIVGTNSLKSLNHELFLTVQVLLEENLNVSETARKLYIHRNTLLYRIEKFKQETGRDIRNGQDAYMVYLALMLCKGFHTN
ncbi:CdaR family transcriptional regulator [Ammoniphilus sp. YIM 78166]|uniref:PucR family transcriptional regulator n=1 Tax=Ammoniphilus sp. YIM 78166 TaxID=1644106 RepID=UPI00107038E8|nr:helix-turn-helix domain-containing protein [Ammoniphilus sp. YIM 78166]